MCCNFAHNHVYLGARGHGFDQSSRYFHGGAMSSTGCKSDHTKSTTTTLTTHLLFTEHNFGVSNASWFVVWPTLEIAGNRMSSLMWCIRGYDKIEHYRHNIFGWKNVIALYAFSRIDLRRIRTTLVRILYWCKFFCFGFFSREIVVFVIFIILQYCPIDRCHYSKTFNNVKLQQLLEFLTTRSMKIRGCLSQQSTRKNTSWPTHMQIYLLEENGERRNRFLRYDGFLIF